MNIINFSIDNELMGARNLGSREHQNLRSSFATTSTTNVNTFICDVKSMVNTNQFTSRLPYLLREHEYDLSSTNLNKIFTAQWLDDRRAIMGTKCNKLVLLDTQSGRQYIQNPLKSHKNSRNIQNHCGIHSISINPSNTLLATGAEHVNDIAVYSLPSLEPVTVGYNAHSYWIFDSVWLDDQNVVSGAGDNRLALWGIDSYSSNHPSSNHVTSLKNKILINSKSNYVSSKSAHSSPTTSPTQNVRLNRSWSNQNQHKASFLYNINNKNRLMGRRILKRSSSTSLSSLGTSSSINRLRIRPSIVLRSPISNYQRAFHAFYASNRETQQSSQASSCSSPLFTSSFTNHFINRLISRQEMSSDANSQSNECLTTGRAGNLIPITNFYRVTSRGSTGRGSSSANAANRLG